MRNNFFYLSALSFFAGSRSRQKFQIHADPDPDPQHCLKLPQALQKGLAFSLVYRCIPLHYHYLNAHNTLSYLSLSLPKEYRIISPHPLKLALYSLTLPHRTVPLYSLSLTYRYVPCILSPYPIDN